MSQRLALLSAISLLASLALLALLLSQQRKQTKSDCSLNQSAIEVRALDFASAREGGPILETFTAASVGEDLEPGDADAKLEMQIGQRSLQFPVAALGNCIVLQFVAFNETTQRSYQELSVWNPNAGTDAVVIPDSRNYEESGSHRRIEGTAGDWIVEMRSPPPSSPSTNQRSHDEVVLIHHRTGETRTIAKPGVGAMIDGVQTSGQLVVWAEVEQAANGTRLQRIIVHDPVRARSTVVVEQPFQPQHFTFGIPQLNGETLAWTDRPDATDRRDLYVANVRLGTVTRYDLKSGRYSEVRGISKDGNFVFTSDTTSQFGTNLETRESWLYARAGNADAGNTHIAFSSEERNDSTGSNADGGLYSAKEGLVRFIAEQPGRQRFVVGSWGEWFVWLDGLAMSPQAGRESIPIGPLYFKRSE